MLGALVAGGLALLLTAAPSARADLARGVVFEDRNGDGLRDPEEPGVAGVRVSDGHHVTVTDAAGAWEIAFQGDTVFFVVKPADWMTPVDTWMLPSFYYVHQPAGSTART